MLWIFAARFFMAALRQCEKSEGCFAVFTAQPWTAAVLFKLQFSDGLLAPDPARKQRAKHLRESGYAPITAITMTFGFAIQRGAIIEDSGNCRESCSPP